MHHRSSTTVSPVSQISTSLIKSHNDFSQENKLKSISVLCALPPERNTGMATVDLAASRVLPRLCSDMKFKLYAFGSRTQYTYGEDELPYTHSNCIENAEEYLSSDGILFWGDFIHSRSYWKLDRGAWNSAQGQSDEAETEKETQYRLYSDLVFLKSHDDDRLRKSAIFGSTIITTDAIDELD